MSELEQTVSFLARVPLFQSLNRGQLESLSRSFVPRNYAAGEEIVTQGKGGIGLYILVSGKAEAVHTRGDGTQAVVNTFRPADFFGELAMLSDEPRTATVVALEDTKCLVLARWDFLAKLELDGKMATVILKELAQRFQRAMTLL
jgi:CRP/FNR family transcriptional regulator, cyclic AMP receptor protein